MERLQKFMASAGVASRRKSEELILEGKVKVNGQLVTELGFKVSQSDLVEVEGKEIYKPKGHVYYLLNKPTGYVTTVSDPQGRKTVMELVPKDHRVFPVGRLDIMTEGLLILTDDGELAYKLTHPKHMVEKEYHVKVNGIVAQEHITNLREGIMLDDGKTSPAKVEILNIQGGEATLSLIIHEGKNRQVRRMMEAVGRKVITLRRVKYGNLTLEGVQLGKYRNLTEEEVQWLIQN
ncbi:rRNA pseudouridine synthase [Alkalicella caledoniensis]|uniref:Pseudouridine synthase n=1 Tax=Alkalicella caledoniensis TaxID=2731377 RepID=A0A7G9WDH5_ALKCA|nr:rRNA pseudouridine synthase [Alkalicella caledoniensis]